MHRLTVLDEPFSWPRFSQGLAEARQRLSIKPQGFWWGCDEAWLRWVESESESGLPGKYPFLYELRVDTRALLRLTTHDETLAFLAYYGKRNKYGDTMIDWPRVARDAGGIEFCDYVHGRYLHDERLAWASTWNVPSGCLWQPEVLLDVVPMQSERTNPWRRR